MGRRCPMSRGSLLGEAESEDQRVDCPSSVLSRPPSVLRLLSAAVVPRPSEAVVHLPSEAVVCRPLSVVCRLSVTERSDGSPVHPICPEV
jgi:hypothetical protein